jgi:hypothetical protein
MTRSQTRIAELEARIAELEKENAKLKKETKEYRAVEQFIMESDIDSALRAHYREGKVIDGEWVNDENSDEDDEDEDEDEDEDKDKDKDKKDGNELSFLELATGIINEAYRQQEERRLLSQ